MIKLTTKFEKDLARCEKRGKNLSKLQFVISELDAGKQLGSQYKDHKLIGNYNGYRECHIEPDWLLVYKVEDDILFLTRTGSHSDLF